MGILDVITKELQVRATNARTTEWAHRGAVPDDYSAIISGLRAQARAEAYEHAIEIVARCWVNAHVDGTLPATESAPK